MQQAQNAIGPKNSLAFKLIAVLLPFILLLLLEIILRLSGYGHDLALFVTDAKDPASLVMNPHVSERYFTSGANATTGNSETFKAVKAKGVTRIFVLGESTTLGYPYMHNGGFPRWLKYRLLQMYPDADFEIINLSLTAVNSYTILDMAKELPRYQPNAVLIYSGHNEYYGALGVGSTSHFGNTPWLVNTIIKLKQFRVMQLILSIFQTAPKKEGNRTLMERMADDQHIPYGSEKFRDGIRQFTINMETVCRLLSNQHIPVFISNLVSNDRDLPPLVSNKTESDTSAASLYQKGRAALALNDTALARQLLVAARDHDLLRFRAPEQINAAIAHIAGKYSGVYLVDTRSFFEKRSVAGIIGKETLLEHVHPNLLGYALMSEAFFQALQARHLLPSRPVMAVSLDQLQREMPVTKTDSLFGAYSITQLKIGWPFNEPGLQMPLPVTEEEKIAMDMLARHLPWNDAMDRLMSHYQQDGDRRSALKVAEAVMLEYPQDATFYVFAGRVCVTEKQYPKALNYLARAFKITPSLDLAHTLYALELKTEHPQKAMMYLDYAIRQTGNIPVLVQTKNDLAQLIRLNEASQKQPGDSLLRLQVKKAYQNLP
jgi:tetratricopeptide (TPR) repeat protein